MTFDNEYLDEKFEDVQSQIDKQLKIEPNTKYKLVLSNCKRIPIFIEKEDLTGFTNDDIIHTIFNNHYNALKIFDYFKNEIYINYSDFPILETEDEESFCHIFLYKV